MSRPQAVVYRDPGVLEELHVVVVRLRSPQDRRAGAFEVGPEGPPRHAQGSVLTLFNVVDP